MARPRTPSAPVTQARPLPPRANLEHLSNQAKSKLAELRMEDPKAKLATAQYEVARSYGFRSWRAMKARVDDLRSPQRERRVRDFIDAVRRRDLPAVKAMADEDPTLVYADPPDGGWRPILIAADAEHRGAEPGMVALLTLYPLPLSLREAAALGRTDAVDAIVRHHPAELNSIDAEGMTPLLWAIRGGHAETALRLLAMGADANVREPGGRAPLHMAAEQGDGRLVDELLKAGADPEAALPDEQRAVDMAERRGHADVAALLRRAAPGVAAAPPADAIKAFGDAIYRNGGDVEAVRELLGQHPALANARPWTPRFRNGALEAVAGMCVWHRPKMHQIAKLLVERGAEGDLPTLARAGLLEAVKPRLDASPEAIDQADDKKRTALFRSACVSGKFHEGEAVADELMRRGAAVDLFTAATFGMEERAAELLRRDPALARARDGDGGTALHWAVRPRRDVGGSIRITRMLLDAGADPNARDGCGQAPLHYAGDWSSSVLQAQAVIDAGGDVNAAVESDDEVAGWTPLDFALNNKRTEMIEFLRGRGGKSRDELGTKL